MLGGSRISIVLMNLAGAIGRSAADEEGRLRRHTNLQYGTVACHGADMFLIGWACCFAGCSVGGCKIVGDCSGKLMSCMQQSDTDNLQ